MRFCPASLSKIIICLFLACWAAAWAVVPQKPVSIAVQDLVPGNGVDSSDAMIISDRLRSALLNTGRFSVMERNEVDAILKEQGLQNSGACQDNSCIVEIGQLLTVKRMIAGSLGKVGTLYSIVLRDIDVETGAIVHSVMIDCPYGSIEVVATKSIQDAVAKLVEGSEDPRGDAATLADKYCDIFITSNDSGASLAIDGEPRSEHPPCLIRHFPAGNHYIAVSRGVLTGARTVYMAPDTVLTIDVPLNGGVRIFSDPPGARVSVDMGEAQAVTPCRVSDLSIGRHGIRMVMPGYLPLSCSTEVSLQDPNPLVEKTLLPAGYLVVAPPAKAKNARFLIWNSGASSIAHFNDTVAVSTGSAVIERFADHKAHRFDTLSLQKGQICLLNTVLKPDAHSLRMRKLVRSLIVGAAALSFGAAGIYENSQASDLLDHAQSLYAQYRQDQGVLADKTLLYDRAERERATADKMTKRRNGLYAAAGVCAGLLGVSIVF